jgi:CheY-like chemotaxis protein
MGSDKQPLDSEFRMPNPEEQSPDPRVTHAQGQTPRRILVVVEDLFFLAKIREAAKHLGIELQGARPEQAFERLAERGYSLVILDLNHRSGRAIEVLEVIKKDPSTRDVPVLGFLSHVQGDLAAAARASACDTVMARSAFSQRLVEILSAYARN